jgi:hypothetical protein
LKRFKLSLGLVLQKRGFPSLKLYTLSYPFLHLFRKNFFNRSSSFFFALFVVGLAELFVHLNDNYFFTRLWVLLVVRRHESHRMIFEENRTEREMLFGSKSCRNLPGVGRLFKNFLNRFGFLDVRWLEYLQCCTACESYYKVTESFRILLIIAVKQLPMLLLSLNPCDLMIEYKCLLWKFVGDPLY